MIFMASLLVALLVHVFLGWPWSVLGGLTAGIMSHRMGWLIGFVAVAFSWGLLVLYSFATAPPETARFLSITAGLLGNMSGPMVVVVTVSMGALLGLLGGAIGGLGRRIADDVRQKRRA